MWNRYVIRRKINSFCRRMKWTRAPMRPINGWITVTWRCNLRCRHCVHSPDVGMPPNQFEDMKPEVYEQVRRKILPYLQWVYLSAGGEPFLAPIFYRLLEDALDAGKRCWVVTNGTINKPKYLEMLVRTPSVIVVSIDGTTPEVMRHIRGVELDLVLDFLKTLKEISSRVGHPEFRVGLGCVVTRSNVEQLTDYVEMARRYGVHSLAFNNFETFGRKDEFALTESLMDRPDIVLPRWERAKQRATELGIGVSPIFFNCPTDSKEERKRFKPTVYDQWGRIRICSHPWWSIYVETNGLVKPCCVPPNAYMGNLMTQSFRRIWNGPEYRELRRTVNTPEMPEFCKNCFIPARIY